MKRYCINPRDVNDKLSIAHAMQAFGLAPERIGDTSCADQ